MVIVEAMMLPRSHEDVIAFSLGSNRLGGLLPRPTSEREASSYTHPPPPVVIELLLTFLVLPTR